MFQVYTFRDLGLLFFKAASLRLQASRVSRLGDFRVLGLEVFRGLGL